MTDIIEGLRAVLLANAGVSAAAGARIYPVQLPQGDRGPSLVLTRVSGLGDYNMQGASGLSRPRVQVDAWATTPDAARSLGHLAKLALSGFAGTVTIGAYSPAHTIVIQGVFFDIERDTYDELAKLFGSSRDYFVWYAER